MPFWRRSQELRYGKLPHTDIRAPRLVIQVRSPRQEQLVREVPAILDTGSDRTCIPMSVIAKLGELFEYGEVSVHGAVGVFEKKPTYVVHLKFGQCDFLDQEVVALDEEVALIGRDLLNLHKIILDGPRSRFRLYKAC